MSSAGNMRLFLARRAQCVYRHFATLSAIALITTTVLADDPPKTEEDLQRDKAIAEFTARMKVANYPELFDKAATEFGVPADILKGVAFAETRWEHLTWPPGETASPETGMPRPYGIMSLWDNEYFGHSLTEAAKLIGEDPQKLKDDPLTNIRGAAALLKKLYGENPKPEGTAEQDVESWRYAIVKYCGIPEPDLSHRHGLDVYEFMNDGYDQYGIQWNARPVKLDAMRAEVKKIVAEEDKKREERLKAEEDVQFAMNRVPPGINQPTDRHLREKTGVAPDASLAVALPRAPSSRSGWLVWALVALAAIIVAVVLMNSRKGKAQVVKRK